MSATDTFNVETRPDGDASFAKIVDGPNAGYLYVNAVTYTMHRTFWVNQWLKSDWPVKDMAGTPLVPQDSMYNRYDAANVLFGGNADLIPAEVPVHEMTGQNSHQNRFTVAIEGCGNSAKHVERVVATDSATMVGRINAALSDSWAWIGYLSSHRFVHGMIDAYFVERKLISTFEPRRKHFQDSADNSISEPGNPCVM